MTQYYKLRKENRAVITCPAARIRTETTKCLWCQRLHPIWIKPDQLKDEVLVDPEIIMEKTVIDPTKRPRLGYFIRVEW